MFLSTAIKTSGFTWWIIWRILCYSFSSCLHHLHSPTLATAETSLVINTKICWKMWNIQHCTLYLPLCLCLFLVLCEVIISVLWSHLHLITKFLTVSLPSSGTLNNEISPPQCLKLVFMFMKTQSTNHNVPVFSKFTFTITKIFLTYINYSIHKSVCILTLFLYLLVGSTEVTDSPKFLPLLSDRGCPLAVTPIVLSTATNLFPLYFGFNANFFVLSIFK